MSLRFDSYRSPVYGRRGMVASSQPLASEAGMRILQKGGNAADAIYNFFSVSGPLASPIDPGY